MADLRPTAQAAAPGAAVEVGASFAANCAACHQANGQGLPGVFPPLAGSEWVVGDPKVLANILLHGVSGKIEVAGQSFDGMMPAFAQLSDAESAGVLTHIRSTWGTRPKPSAPTLLLQKEKLAAHAPRHLKAVKPSKP